MMNFNDLVVQFGVYPATFIYCLVSGVFPILNTEVFLLTISAFSSTKIIVPVVVISTSAQLIAKSLIYFSSLGILKFPITKYEQKVEKIKVKFEKWKTRQNLFIFISAFSGLPPFYLVAILAGQIKLNYWRFLIVGFVGVLIRYFILMWFPQTIKIFL